MTRSSAIFFFSVLVGTLETSGTSAVAIDRNVTSLMNELPYSSQPCFSLSNTPEENLVGNCRPSFIIVGAGKAGTSSLYAYLNDHPNVIQAKVKQTHFWKYDYPDGLPLNMYFENFPRSPAFELGADERTTQFVTGEASPGYLPDERSAKFIGRHLRGVRILMLFRDPVERALSSYIYNYLNVVKEEHRKKSRGTVSVQTKFSHMNAILAEEEEIDNESIVTFEEFVDAEMRHIRRCLKKKGLSAAAIDIFKLCFDGDETVEKQWEGLERSKNGKARIVRTHSSYLIRTMLARGFYQSQHDLWLREGHDIHVMCTEQMNLETGDQVLKDAASFIGLPEYNFTDTIFRHGILNSKENPGYEVSTTWREHALKHPSAGVSPATRKKIIDFLKEHDATLTGWGKFSKSCGWDDS